MPTGTRKSIGVFDSGFGGLNTLKSIVKALPQYNYIYLGDSARAPYGNRSQKEVYEFTRQAVDFLFKQNCKLVILACNTASSEALRKIQREYLPKLYPDRRVLGVLIPAAEFAIVKTKNHRIGVMATSGTVTSASFKRELTKLRRHAQVYQQACPLLVPIVETGRQDSKTTGEVLKKYLRPLLAKNIDTLILGCTHYGILEKKIKSLAGRKVQIISETQAVPQKLKEYLKRHLQIEKKLEKGKRIKFYSTGRISKFQKLGSKFFGKKIRAKKAVLT